MKTTDHESQLERTIERCNDLEAYIHLMAKDGAEPERLYDLREQLAALQELCLELKNCAADRE